ncbi:MAG: hypothetical protein AAGD43_06725 [Pseudomonadota bacterium]
MLNYLGELIFGSEQRRPAHLQMSAMALNEQPLVPVEDEAITRMRELWMIRAKLDQVNVDLDVLEREASAGEVEVDEWVRQTREWRIRISQRRQKLNDAKLRCEAEIMAIVGDATEDIPGVLVSWNPYSNVVEVTTQHQPSE